MSKFHLLKRSTNQAVGLAEYAKRFLTSNSAIDSKVYERVKMFHTDSVVCGISALALKTNAPTLLRKEALDYYNLKNQNFGSELKNFRSKVFGSSDWVAAEKAIVANCSAVREWDSNGTVFGYNNEIKGHQAGEFGHNDFYPVVIAAAHTQNNMTGKDVLRGMILLDEIRGRLAEVFSLKSYKIDHVVHGAIASAVTYGAMVGASTEQIESAVGMVVAHYIPWRAIRAGKQLSDSKGASAAISTEVAITSVRRAMAGFIGPKDIFRNPESIFRYFQKTDGDSPFDIALSEEGSKFALMDMHFKLGLYEHQSAGALEGVIKLIQDNPELIEGNSLKQIQDIVITAYEPAFGIIGDPAKRDPKTRQSADHSMVFIVSRLLKKAINNSAKVKSIIKDRDSLWKELILTPLDYSYEALKCNDTKELMSKIKFLHGGKEYDDKYPEGIPTKVDVNLANGKNLSSGLVMFPSGHSKNTTCNLKDILNNKNKTLLKYAISSTSESEKLLHSLNNIENMTNRDLEEVYNCKIELSKVSIDESGFDTSQFSK
jgi:2-methylcitrate dehydratase